MELTGKQFWLLSEGATVFANVWLLLLGSGVSYYFFQTLPDWRLLIYALALLFFHLGVNVFNNAMDYQHASEAHTYKTDTSSIGVMRLSLVQVKKSWLSLFFLASFFGLLLVFLTDDSILVLGIGCFALGILYSAGPKPLNSTFLAEFVPALAIGLFVPAVSIYLTIGSNWSWHWFLKRMWVLLPNVLLAFMGLLANNICDLVEDIINGRRTFVYYLGKKRAIGVLKIIFLGLLGSYVGNVWAGLAPTIVLLMVGAVLLAWVQLAPFFNHPDKKKTFPLVMKAAEGLMFSYTFLYLLGLCQM